MAATIGITGGSISGNKGAEAMVTAVIGSIRRRIGDAEFVIWSPYYAADKELGGRYENTVVADGTPLALVVKIFPSSALSWLAKRIGADATGLFRETRLLSKCDVLVDVAGISFSDGREIYLPFNVLTIWPAMMLRVDVAKMSQACGPFRNPVNRVLAKIFLRRCKYLAARGESTAKNLATIGIAGAPVCPDVAFLLNDITDDAAGGPDVGKYLEFGDRAKRVVAISPSSEVYKRCGKEGIDYVGIHAEFVRRLVGIGYRVLVAPHSTRPNTDKLKNNDLPVARLLMKAAGGTPEAAMVEDELDSVTLRRLMGRCDFCLASRFHGMISALAMGVPVMVCGWGHKYFEILDMFAQRQYAFDYRGMSADKMTETFRQLAQNEADVRKTIKAALGDVMARSRAQIDAVVEIVESKRRGASGGG